jgi:hypothetical protein
MKRVVASVLALTALVVLALHLVRRADPPVAPPAEPAVPSTGEPVAPVEPAVEDRVEPRETSPMSGTRRVLVPPPTDPITPRAPRLARGGELADRREGPRASDAEEQLEAMRATMAAVEEDVEECLRAWSQVAPEIQGQVTMVFQIDESGLGKLWIQEHDQIPAGPMTCFASAIYGVDWSHISREPIEISNRFVIEDGAPAQVELYGPPEEPSHPERVDATAVSIGPVQRRNQAIEIPDR